MDTLSRKTFMVEEVTLDDNEEEATIMRHRLLMSSFNFLLMKRDMFAYLSTLAYQ